MLYGEKVWCLIFFTGFKLCFLKQDMVNGGSLCQVPMAGESEPILHPAGLLI